MEKQNLGDFNDLAGEPFGGIFGEGPVVPGVSVPDFVLLSFVEQAKESLAKIVDTLSKEETLNPARKVELKRMQLEKSTQELRSKLQQVADELYIKLVSFRRNGPQSASVEIEATDGYHTKVCESEHSDRLVCDTQLLSDISDWMKQYSKRNVVDACARLAVFQKLFLKHGLFCNPDQCLAGVEVLKPVVQFARQKGFTRTEIDKLLSIVWSGETENAEQALNELAVEEEAKQGEQALIEAVNASEDRRMNKQEAGLLGLQSETLIFKQLELLKEKAKRIEEQAKKLELQMVILEKYGNLRDLASCSSVSEGSDYYSEDLTAIQTALGLSTGLPEEKVFRIQESREYMKGFGVPVGNYDSEQLFEALSVLEEVLKGARSKGFGFVEMVRDFFAALERSSYWSKGKNKDSGSFLEKVLKGIRNNGFGEEVIVRIFFAAVGRVCFPDGAFKEDSK